TRAGSPRRRRGPRRRPRCPGRRTAPSTGPSGPSPGRRRSGHGSSWRGSSSSRHRRVRDVTLTPPKLATRPPWRWRAELAFLVILAVLGALSAVLTADEFGLPLTLAWVPLLLLWWRHDAPVAVVLIVELASVPSRALYG